MKKLQSSLVVVVIICALGICGCSKKTDSNHGEHGHSHEEGQTQGHSHTSSEKGEHDRDSHEHHGAAGEESGTQLALDDTYNATRNGAQLYLAFNSENNAFEGWVRNNTSGPLKQVRVEVHLSNGKELGPTEPTDLAPGQQIEVKLTAVSKDFTHWTAHPEVASAEHDHGDHGHEHTAQGEHI